MTVNNGSLVSGRVPVTDYANLTADRYQFLSVAQAEPNLGAGENGNVLTLGASNTRVWTNILSVASVSATGNISGNYFIGNGSQLTDVIASSANAETLTGTFISSNVTGSSLTSVGILSNLSVSGDTTSGNLYTGGTVSATGTVTGGNLVTAGSGGDITMTGGNITGANVVTANTFIGNGRYITGVAADSANAETLTGTFINSTVTGSSLTNVGILSNLSVSGDTTSGNVSAVGSITSSNISVSGNINAGNVIATNVAIDRGTATTNWDSLINMGTYSVDYTSWSGTTGTPIDSAIYVGLLSVLTSGTTTTQTFYPGTVTAENVKIQWDRTLYSGTWTPWYKILNDFQVVDAGIY